MTDKKKYKSIIVTNETHEVIKKLADQDNRRISMFLKNLVSKYASENFNEDINLDENNKHSSKGLNFLNNFNEFELKNILKLISGSGLNERQEFILRKIIVDDSSYDGVVSSGTFTHGHVGPSAMDELVRITKAGGLVTISVNEKHWINFDFESEIERFNKYIRNYTLKKISIYGEQSTHDHKDDKAIILTIKV